MNEQVKAIVEGFRLLPDTDQTDAYLEIEIIWRKLQNEPAVAGGLHPEPRQVSGAERAP